MQFFTSYLSDRLLHVITKTVLSYIALSGSNGRFGRNLGIKFTDVRVHLLENLTSIAVRSLKLLTTRFASDLDFNTNTIYT